MKKTKYTTPKRYKVYLTLWKDKTGTEKNRLNHEEQKELILRLIAKYPQTYFYNQNKTQDNHYPIFYNDRFYFGQPICLTAVTEKEINEMLEFFKSEGLCWWVTYLHEMFSYDDLEEQFNISSLNDLNLKMDNINRQRLYIH